MAVRSMTSRFFISATAQYTNLGDLLIRRAALGRCRKHGALHVFLGDAPESWIAGLHLDDSDVLYTSRFQWWSNLILSPRRSSTLVFSPGEFPLSRRILLPELLNLLVVLLARCAGQRVMRLGRSVTNVHFATRLVHRVACGASNLTIWRDTESFEEFKHGLVTPDIAFAEPTVLQEKRARPHLAVSMRGDRYIYDPTWTKAVGNLANKLGLSIVLVVQVEPDNEIIADLEHTLNPSRSLSWLGASHVDHEARVREAYRSSQVVISDRLHALALGAIEGAVPIAFSPQESRKISRNLTTAGLAGQVVAVDSPNLDHALTVAAGRESDVAAAFERAREIWEMLPLSTVNPTSPLGCSRGGNQ